MNYSSLSTWVDRKIIAPARIKSTVIAYILFLMVSTRKHSIKAAAAFADSSKSRFSIFLKQHSDLAVHVQDELSKKQARQFGKTLEFLGGGALPWRVAIIIDATLHRRSSLRTDNAQRFNHGAGFVIGHQWTNIVLYFNNFLIPLPPIAFYSRNYRRKHNLAHKTEHENVIEYLENLDLTEYIGDHSSENVVVLADSGYDNKKIEQTIHKKGWKYIIALKKKRSVKTENDYARTTKDKGWYNVEKLFKNHRRIKWKTVFMRKNSAEKKRMEFRLRQITAYLRHAGKVQLVCSEFAKRPKSPRKYLSCNDFRVTGRQILLGYRIRWEIEIFHKMVKMFLGFEDVAVKTFESVRSHVHWCYCAYILLHSHPPGMPENLTSVVQMQNKVTQAFYKKHISGYMQILTRANGAQQLKTLLQKVLTDDNPNQSLFL